MDRGNPRLLNYVFKYGHQDSRKLALLGFSAHPHDWWWSGMFVSLQSHGCCFVCDRLLCVLHQGGGHGHSHGPVHSSKNKKKLSLSSGARRDGDTDDGMLIKKTKKLRDNLNVRAASIHVIGDLLQTVGIVITSYLVWFRVSWPASSRVCLGSFV